MARFMAWDARRMLVVPAVLAALLAPVLGFGATAKTYADVNQQGQAKCDTNIRFFGLVPWYRYLTITPDKETGTCRITSFDKEQSATDTDDGKVLGKTSPILLIALAILEDLIRVSALVAVGFVIYGGFQYLTSQGSPDDTKRAQQTIINALIGLVIALMAVGIVSFIGTQLGGK